MGRAEKGSRRTLIRLATGVATLVVGLGCVGAAQAQLPPVPIPTLNFPPAPAYVGNPATPHPVTGIPATPQNPFMAPNGESEIHDDGWQTDVNWWGGPLGREPQGFSNYLNRDCGSITFDHQGRVIAICVGVPGPELYMFDPNTLETLATFQLPPRQHPPSNIFQDFTGGGYFYLDNQDRVVAATTTHHIFVIAETPGSPGFTLVHDYDLTSALTAKADITPSNEDITSALPDSNGILWFVTKTDGVVGTLNLGSGAIHAVHLGNGSDGEIENSFATDQNGGVYIATNRKLYRFASSKDNPRIVPVWQVTYPNSGEHKPGQVDDGTGTTPTVMPGGYVNITDNADPMDIVVYRTAAHPSKLIRRHGRLVRVPLPRQVCRVPIFAKGQGADENSVISAGRMMIAENNYGYTDPTSVQGKVTAPGFVRVDLNADGSGCHLVWQNTTEAAPTVVSKLALADGLVYTYTTDANGDWYWTALDYRTGAVVYKVLAGNGVGYNNNYSGISISPSGTAYLGALGGILALRDAVPTPQPAPAPAPARSTAPARHRRHHLKRRHAPSRRPRRQVSFTG